MKCICSGGCWMTGFCIMQLITIAVRQTFDLLGLQWSCIIANFCQITVIILALYGVCREKRGFVAVYCAWNLIWMGWNVLLICVYLGVVSLEYDAMIMNLDLSESFSWFKTNAYNCSPLLTQTDFKSTDVPFDSQLCILDYRHIEIFQSGLQFLLSVLGFSVGCYKVGKMKEDDKLHSIYLKKRTKEGSEEIPLQSLSSRDLRKTDYAV